MWVAVELAQESVAVFLGPFGQPLDEVLDLLSASLAERLRAAEVDGVGFYEFGIELVLADELAEAVPNFGDGTLPLP